MALASMISSSLDSPKSPMTLSMNVLNSASRLKLMHDLVMVVAMPQSELGLSYKGLYLPTVKEIEATCMNMDDPVMALVRAQQAEQWLGVIVKIGPEAQDHGLDFGDVYALNKRAESEWFNWIDEEQKYNRHTKGQSFACDYDSRVYNCDGDDKVAFLHPLYLIMRYARWDAYNAHPCPVSRDGGPNRVILRMERPKNILEYQISYSTYGLNTGEVLSIGAGVEDIEVGQMAVANPERGFRWKEPDDDETWYCAILDRYIEAVFDKAELD